MENKEKRNNLTFAFEGGKPITIEAYQSPRGLRHEDKRPNLVTIDCYTDMTQIELIQYINYLTTIVHCMEWQQK